MREIIELNTNLETLLEIFLKAQTANDKGQVARLSSDILGSAKNLPELFDRCKHPDMSLEEEMNLLAQEKETVFLFIRCFAYVSSKRREIGPLIQTLLVDIYDCANEGVHYLTKDLIFETYHEAISDAVEFGFHVFREANIKYITQFYIDIFMPWIHGIQSPIRKAAKRYFRDECREWAGHEVSEITFEPKETGAQLGTKACVNFRDGFPSVTFHVKAHQNYGASSSGIPSNQRKQIDLRELFVYKLLHSIGFGPKVHFITHQGAEDVPFYKNALFIATQEVAYTKEAGKTKFFHPVGQLFSYDGLDFKGDTAFAELFEKELSTPEVTPIKLAATIIDLLSRILDLTDMNEGNFGRINSIDGKTKWEILDFMISPKGSHYIGGSEKAAWGFIEGNGAFRYSNETLLSKALTERPAHEKVALGLAALEMLNTGRMSLTRPDTRKMPFKEAVERSYHEVLAYMQENMGGKNRAALLGMEKEEKAYESLKLYVEILLQNFEDLQKGLQAINTGEIEVRHRMGGGGDPSPST